MNIVKSAFIALTFTILSVGLWNVSVSVSEETVPTDTAKTETAIFAGGCFWCVESDFDKVPGVKQTISGFTGGKLADPTYKTVSAGGTGHIEAVQIKYDPSVVSYARLLEIFWRSVDPTDAGGQFCDRGATYATAIFATGDEQLKAAQKSKQELIDAKRLPKPIVTKIYKASTFYPAATSHQDYYKKNPIRYRVYRYGCGRDKRIKQLWGSEAHGGLPHS